MARRLRALLIVSCIVAISSSAIAPPTDDTELEVTVDGDTEDFGTIITSADVTQASSPPLQPGEHNAAWDLFGAHAEPNQGAVVLHGAGRFTVLTDGVVRLEFSPHSPPVFHDEGSFAFINRYFDDVPEYSVSVDGGVLTLETSRILLTYDAAAAPRGAFTAASMRAVIKGTGATWTPGAPATGSLHGTIRTLDRIGRALSIACTQRAYLNDSHCEEGVVSRDGWALLDDSLGARWEAYDTTWPWTTGPAEPPPRASPQTCLAQGWDRWECIWGNHLVNETACAAKGCCFDPVAAAAADGQPTAQHFVAWCWWPDDGGRSEMYSDWYLFGHGHDYRAALRDYRDIAGPPALLPEYALGPHYSRWFSYADFEEREIMATFARNAIPLSVVEIDMDWHDSFPRGVPNVPQALVLPRELEPWTGFTVWEAMYPAVQDMLAHLHARGVRTMWNLHPHFGLQFYDKLYDEFAEALGRRADAAEGRPLLGDFTNRTWAEAFFALPIARLQALGIDAWWIDWQQGEWTPIPGLSPTAWLSYIFSSDPNRFGSIRAQSAPVLEAAGLPPDAALAHAAFVAEDLDRSEAHEGSDDDATKLSLHNRRMAADEPDRNGIRFHDRPFIMNRWGGLGSHRYPVGFSGDAETSWEVLRWQAYLTPTAANLAWQWSHDIGGFQGEPGPELMVRWAQFGALSPVLRPHTAGRNGACRDLWSFPWFAFEAMRDTFRLRARLAPYLATAARVGFDTGVVMAHPLYYDFAEDDGAYGDQALHQYSLGDALWVAPVTSPAPTDHVAAGLATQEIWFPDGPWIEWGSWQRVSGGGGDSGDGSGLRSRRYALTEIPMFSRPATIITLATLPAATDLLGHPFDAGGRDDLTFWVLPPDAVAVREQLRAAAAEATHDSQAIPRDVLVASSVASLYDDDGVSTAYAHGAYSWTPISCEWWASADGEDIVACAIHPRDSSTDSFPEAPEARFYTWRFAGTFPPSRVSLLVEEPRHETVDGDAGDESAVYLFDASLPLAQAGVPDAWGDQAVWPSEGSGAWAYSAATASTWVRLGSPLPVSAVVTVTLHFPGGAGGCVFANDVVTSGVPRRIARAQAAKGAMNKAAWSVYPVDVPTLIHAAGVPARVESAVTAAAAGRLSVADAAAVAEAEFSALASDLADGARDVDAIVRGVHHVGDDVSLRMLGFAVDGADGGWV